MDERVKVRATSCPYDGKLSLKADESHVSQRHEDVEGKREYYHIISTIIVMKHFNSVLFHKSRPFNKQLTINKGSNIYYGVRE